MYRIFFFEHDFSREKKTLKRRHEAMVEFISQSNRNNVRHKVEETKQNQIKHLYFKKNEFELIMARNTETVITFCECYYDGYWRIGNIL